MFIKRIADKIFKNTISDEEKGVGLYVTVDELAAQRRYAHQWQTAHLHRFTSDNAGDVKSVFKGRGMEFEEIRAYEFGDDVRDIDWRVTARKQKPYTKLFNEEKDREVYVILDLSPQMLFGTRRELKSVTAAKIAARIAWQSLKNKDRFGCVIDNGQEQVLLKAQNSQANMMMIFKKIADTTRVIYHNYLAENKTPRLIKAISLLQKAIKHRAIVFVVSDFTDFADEGKKVLALLAKKADVTCVNVFDVLEKCPPAEGEYMVQQGNQRLVFSTQGKTFCDEYVHYFAEKRQYVRDFCRKFKIHYFESSNDECSASPKERNALS